jgi:TRAP-type C4-dicarboxylate transport system substrate-binding protein
MFNKRALRIFMIVIVVFAFATVAYASAAANSVPTSKAGDGSGVISGYTVTAVHYTLNGTNPTTIDSVTFTLDTAPVAGGTLKIKLVSSGSTWYGCTNVTTAVTCTTTGAPVSTADSLEVVAAQ